MQALFARWASDCIGGFGQVIYKLIVRLHYEPRELNQFENVESEWPLFFTYLILDGLFRGDKEQVELYRSKLDAILVDSDSSINASMNLISQNEKSMKLVPELYIVPKHLIDAEKQNPGSQERRPNENLPLVWAQSLYILGNLIYDEHLTLGDVDPIGRRHNYGSRKVDTVVQIAWISESAELQQKLMTYGLETQTAEDCEPYVISEPSALRDAYRYLGKNEKLVFYI